MRISHKTDYRPYISVLMPVYRPNKEFFKEAVESILYQTYDNFELLLLYEKSDEDENLESIIDAYCDDRIKILYMPPKSGLPKSLNIGIRESRGELIARMDADDISTLHRFERQVAYMNKHPKTDMLSGTVRILGTSRLMNRFAPNAQEKIARCLFDNPGIAHPTIMMRKKFLEDNDLVYDEAMGGCEDYALWSDAICVGGIIDSVKDILLDYRIHDWQVSVVQKDRLAKWNELIQRKQRNRYNVFFDIEHQILEEFGEKKLFSYPPSDIENCLNKIIEGNKKKRLCDHRILSGEIAWQWIRNAQTQKRLGNDSLLKSKMYRKCFTPRNLPYILKNVFYAVFSRVI